MLPCYHLGLSTHSERTLARLGHFSATESDNSKNSSAATTPKNSTRKLAFSPSGDVGNSGYRYAHWEDHPHKKRREGPPEGDDAAGAGGGGGTTV